MYKYFKVDEHALANLSGGRLYCHHYEDFNDPFECWCMEVRSIPDPIAEPERFLRVRDAWLGPLSGPAEDPVVMESFAEYVESLTDYPWSIVDGYKESARISCFSASGDNLLMWAHYADGLRGFSVEFDEKELLRGTPAGAEVFRVHYQRHPEPFDLCVYEVAHDQMEWHERQLFKARAKRESFVGDLDNEFQAWANDSRERMREMYAKLLATKPIEWEYEQEMRLIFHSDATDHAGVLFHYSDASIKSVIIGDRMSAQDRSELLRVLAQKGLAVPVKVAARDTASFKVNIRG